jgi:hypothetical protein
MAKRVNRKKDVKPAIPWEGRYRVYAGMGRTIPQPLSEDDFIDSYDAVPVAQKEYWRQQTDKDWAVIFDSETGGFFSTWTTGRIVESFTMGISYRAPD